MIKNLFNRNLISISNLSKKDINKLFQLTEDIKFGLKNVQSNKNIGLLFFQPSTRTRMSFEIAAKKMGMNTLLESNPLKNSAMAKEETLHDVLKTMSNYVDLIVLRHQDEKEVFKNIKNINIPIINGGWGNFEHPTQALIDLYTFKNRFKNYKNIRLSIVGDPNTRTSISISELALKFGIQSTFIYPSELLPKNKNEELIYENIDDKKQFQDYVKNFNLIYYSNWTGTEIDNNRNNLYEKYFLPFNFLYNSNIIVYSPLPRDYKMDVNADDTLNQLSFEGVENSVYLRMALLHSQLEIN